MVKRTADSDNGNGYILSAFYRLLMTYTLFGGDPRGLRELLFQNAEGRYYLRSPCGRDYSLPTESVAVLRDLNVLPRTQVNRRLGDSVSGPHR